MYRYYGTLATGGCPGGGGSPRKNYDVFSDFHRSGVNTSGSCTFLQSMFFQKNILKMFPLNREYG